MSKIELEDGMCEFCASLGPRVVKVKMYWFALCRRGFDPDFGTCKYYGGIGLKNPKDVKYPLEVE